MNIFINARVKLSFWYIVIILLISGSLSAAFYSRISLVLDTEFERIEHRLQMEQRRFPRAEQIALHIYAEDIALTKRKIVYQLAWVNGLIALGTGVAAYFLAGKTLRPIEESMEEQKRFISDAAHELRTPIAALKTSLEVNLMDKRLGKTTGRILRENLVDLSRLEGLAQGLLRLSRMERDELVREKVLVREFAGSAVRTVKPLAKKKKVKVVVSKFSGDLAVMGDGDALSEMMVILLDNATKYSPVGGKVGVGAVETRRSVLVKVVDKGKGITKEHLPYVFDRFYQADNSRSQGGESGHGLGLCIAKKIVEDHGGKIGVESVVGKGATFVVRLPKA